MQHFAFLFFHVLANQGSQGNHIELQFVSYINGVTALVPFALTN